MRKFSDSFKHRSSSGDRNSHRSSSNVVIKADLKPEKEKKSDDCEREFKSEYDVAEKSSVEVEGYPELLDTPDQSPKLKETFNIKNLFTIFPRNYKAEAMVYRSDSDVYNYILTKISNIGILIEIPEHIPIPISQNVGLPIIKIKRTHNLKNYSVTDELIDSDNELSQSDDSDSDNDIRENSYDKLMKPLPLKLDKKYSDSADKMSNLMEDDISKTINQTRKKHKISIMQLAKRLRLITEKLKYKYTIAFQNILTIITMNNEIKTYRVSHPLFKDTFKILFLTSLNTIYTKLTEDKPDEIKKDFTRLFEISCVFLNRIHNNLFPLFLSRMKQLNDRLENIHSNYKKTKSNILLQRMISAEKTIKEKYQNVLDSKDEGQLGDQEVSKIMIKDKLKPMIKELDNLKEELFNEISKRLFYFDDLCFTLCTVIDNINSKLKYFEDTD